MEALLYRHSGIVNKIKKTFACVLQLILNQDV